MLFGIDVSLVGQSMAPFGQIALSLAFLSAVFGVLFGAVAAFKNNERLREAAYQSITLYTVFISLSTLVLVYSIYTHDFSLKYVQQYSDATQPPLYLITALWGGQAGSLLFWAFVLSIYGSFSFAANRERLKGILPHSITFYMGIALFFTSMMLFNANPFDVQQLGEAPQDGTGLNPLLQTPLMAIHPPSLYIGYIGFSIPFAFAMGALWAGRIDSDWIRATRKATMISFTFLSVGNVLGSWWAYEELGWGGFWAWDPVETAAFFPWLTGTAFLHSVMIQERRGMFKVWNVVLVSLTFFLTVLGTMLTRSGLVESVHAFASSRVGTWFGSFLLITAVLTIGLIIYRYKELRQGSKDGDFHILSREFSFLSQNVILTIMALTLVVFVLTPMFTKEIWPWFQEHLLGRTGKDIVRGEASMGPRFYNQYMAIPALALLFLMGVGPLIAWRKASSQHLLETFKYPVILGVVGTVLAYVLGITAWFPLACFGLSAFVTGTVVQEFAQGTWVRMKSKGEGFMTALFTLTAKGKRRYGGYIVHLGIVAVFMGIAGAFYQAQHDFAAIKLAPRENNNTPYDFARDWKTSFTYGEYSFHYFDLRVVNTPNTEEFRTYVAVKKHDEPFTILQPGRNWYRTHPDQPSSEIDLDSGIMEDLYMTTGFFDPDTGEAAFTVTVNPLVFWLWLGMFMIMAGSGICLAPELRFVRVRAMSTATAMFFGLVLFLIAPMALAQTGSDHEDHEGHNHGEKVAHGAPIDVYPPAVVAAANRLRCYCPCSHTLAQCTRSECNPGTSAKDEMTRMVEKDHVDEEYLVQWYLKTYGGQTKKQNLLLVTPNQGIGPMLEKSVWAIGAGGILVLAAFASYLRKKNKNSTSTDKQDDKTPLASTDEKRLSDELSRLE